MRWCETCQDSGVGAKGSTRLCFTSSPFNHRGSKLGLSLPLVPHVGEYLLSLLKSNCQNASVTVRSRFRITIIDQQTARQSVVNTNNWARPAVSPPLKYCDSLPSSVLSCAAARPFSNCTQKQGAPHRLRQKKRTVPLVKIGKNGQIYKKLSDYLATHSALSLEHKVIQQKSGKLLCVH